MLQHTLDIDIVVQDNGCSIILFPNIPLSLKMEKYIILDLKVKCHSNTHHCNCYLIHYVSKELGCHWPWNSNLAQHTKHTHIPRVMGNHIVSTYHLLHQKQAFASHYSMIFSPCQPS
jgi:hypothetical protein